MHEKRTFAPDWRDAAAYAPLLGADRSIFAWEWLRRDPGYRAAAGAALAGVNEAQLRPQDWGLCAFEDPMFGAPEARPLWCAEVDPFVLEVHAGPTRDSADSFELERLGTEAVVVPASDGREHLLIGDGLRAIRLDVLAGSLREGPVRLSYQLAGIAGVDGALLTLRRFLAVWRTGRFSAGLHPVQARAGRVILALRAHDAVAGGATQREIAAELINSEALEDRWRLGAPSLRSRVQRLVRNARIMARGGHRSLLSI